MFGLTLASDFACSAAPGDCEGLVVVIVQVVVWEAALAASGAHDARALAAVHKQQHGQAGHQRGQHANAYQQNLMDK